MERQMRSLALPSGFPSPYHAQPFLPETYELQRVVDDLLEEELLQLGFDEHLRVLLSTRLRSTVVDIVVNTVRQL
jgi:hypothetical protein